MFFSHVEKAFWIWAISNLESPICNRNSGPPISECGSSLPLFLPLTRQRWVTRRDESRRGKAATSRRTPNFGSFAPGEKCALGVRGQILKPESQIPSEIPTRRFKYGWRRFWPRGRAVRARRGPPPPANSQTSIGETDAPWGTRVYPRARASSANPANCLTESRPLCP